MSTALVIGVTGFCGRHLVHAIRRRAGISVTGVATSVTPPPLAIDRYVQSDLADAARTAALVRDTEPDWVFNLAAGPREHIEGTYSTNTLGLVNLLEAIRRHAPAARVLHVGSASEYGGHDSAAMPLTEDSVCEPADPYGISKHAATVIALHYARAFGLRVALARPFNIVGAGMPPSLVLGAVVDRARRSLTMDISPCVRVGSVDARRDFVAVEDVVEAYVRMLEAGHWGEVYNLCSGRATRVRDLVDMVLAHAPRLVRVEVDPALAPPSGIAVSYGSFAKANRDFGFLPRVALEESLRRAWEGVQG